MIIPSLNLGNLSKVLSHLEIMLLKKSQSSLGIERIKKLSPTDSLGRQEPWRFRDF